MLAFFLSLPLIGDGTDIVTLEVGRAFHGQIEADDRTVRTPFLDEKATPIPVWAKTFRISVLDSDTYHIDMRSRDFDTYIILRDSHGNLIDEDDDGWIPSQSRLVVTLEAEEPYIVQACALHGGIGEFEIILRRGEPEQPSDEDFKAWKLDPRGVVATLRAQGILKMTRGEVEEAQRFLEQALRLAEGSLETETQEHAGCLYDLGRLLIQRRDLQKAGTLLERAVAIQEKLLGLEDLQTCDSFKELGILFTFRGDFRSANTYFSRALKGFERQESTDETRTAYEVLLRCAETTFRMGDWASSERFYRKCLPLASKCYGSNSFPVANNLAMLGSCVYYQGDWAQAKMFYEQAQTTQEREGRARDSFTTDIRRRLAALVMEEGNYDYAERLLRIALKDSEKSRDPENLDVGFAQYLLASLYVWKEEYASAKLACEQALSILDRLLGKDSHYALDCLLQLAEIEIELLDLTRARTLFQTAQRRSEQNPDRMYLRSRVRIEKGLGKLHFLEGDLDKAQDHLTAAGDLLEKHLPGNSLSKVQVFQELTRVAMGRRNPRAAWSFAWKAHDAAENNLQTTIWSLSESERFHLVLAHRFTLDAILDLAHRTTDPAMRTMGFDALSGWKARIFQGMLSTKQRVFRAGNPEVLKALAELQKVQSQISLITSCDPNDAPFYVRKLEELATRRFDLEKTIARLSGPVPEAGRFDWRRLQAALPEKASFINFIEHRPIQLPDRKNGHIVAEADWGKPQLSAWILPKESDGPLLVSLGPSAEVEILLKDFLTALVAQKPSASGAPNPHLGRLNDAVLQRVWYPLAAHFQGDFVIVSSDASIGSLPFGVIQQSNSRYLVEDYHFVNLQDVGGLVRLSGSAPRRGGDLLVVGDVDFQGASFPRSLPSAAVLLAERGLRARHRGSWLPLPSTLEEARTITNLHEQFFPERSRLFLQGAEPTEDRLKSEIPKAPWVHIASHGFFEAEGLTSLWNGMKEGQPAPGILLPGLRSGLVCAGANLPVREERENGLLTAEEVSWLDLSRSDVVVLSACQTGLGTVRGGEGIVGLRTAFLQAGARTVVSSLWSVGDRSTMELMQGFYEGLWAQGMGALQALREAQLRMIERQRQRYNGKAFPCAWGAFILDGDWR